MWAAAGIFAKRLRHVRGQRWTKRRARLCSTYGAMLLIQVRAAAIGLSLLRTCLFTSGETRSCISQRCCTGGGAIRNACLLTVHWCSQIVNSAFWLAPNVAVLASVCFWYHTFTNVCSFMRWCGCIDPKLPIADLLQRCVLMQAATNAHLRHACLTPC